MPKLRLTAVAAVATGLTLLPAAPAAVAGPWMAPWVLGHVIGAAARLATLPIIAASAASSAGQPPPPGTPYWAGYAPPVRYASAPYYYGPPAYYPPPPAYYASPIRYTGGPQNYFRASGYRTAAPYAGASPRPEPFSRYLPPGMRYSDSYGRAVFSRSRGLAYRPR